MTEPLTPEAEEVVSEEAEEIVPGSEDQQPPAEDTGAAAEAAAEKPTDEEPQPGKSQQEEIAELERKAQKAKADAEYWTREKRKRRAEYFKGDDEPPATPAAAEKKSALEPPKEDDFETYEQYQDALIEYKADVKIAQKLKEYETEKSEQESNEQMTAFIGDLIKEGKDKHDDFETVALAESVPITPEMLRLMQNCENPSDVAYYLGSNINVCASIARMGPEAQMRELTKIDLEAGKSAAPKEKPITKAPAPITPSKGATSVAGKDPEKMTQAELEQWWKDRGNRL